MITKDKTYFIRNSDEMELTISELKGFFEEALLAGASLQVDTWINRRVHENLQQPTLAQCAGEVC